MFETEDQLVTNVSNQIKNRVEHLPAFLRKPSQCLLHEVSLGYGVADIVVADKAENILNRTHVLNDFQVLLFDLILDNPGVSLNCISSITRASANKVKNSLDTLLSEKFVSLQSRFFFPEKRYEEIAAKSVAIEAKLKNWKRALHQAYRYKWFAERVFVCMPEQNIRPAVAHINQFRRMKVGIISINAEGDLRFIYSPRPSKPISKKMTVLLNEKLIATTDTSLK